MARDLDLNKRNLMRAIQWITRHDEEIILDKQHELSFLSKEEIERIEYCIKTLESLVEAKTIYDRQKVSWGGSKLIKFAFQILLISLLTILVTAFFAFHVGLAVYLLSCMIALVNYKKMEVE